MPNNYFIKHLKTKLILSLLRPIFYIQIKYTLALFLPSSHFDSYNKCKPTNTYNILKVCFKLHVISFIFIKIDDKHDDQMKLINIIFY